MSTLSPSELSNTLGASVATVMTVSVTQYTLSSVVAPPPPPPPPPAPPNPANPLSNAVSQAVTTESSTATSTHWLIIGTVASSVLLTALVLFIRRTRSHRPKSVAPFFTAGATVTPTGPSRANFSQSRIRQAGRSSRFANAQVVPSFKRSCTEQQQQQWQQQHVQPVNHDSHGEPRSPALLAFMGPFDEKTAVPSLATTVVGSLHHRERPRGLQQPAAQVPMSGRELSPRATFQQSPRSSSPWDHRRPPSQPVASPQTWDAGRFPASFQDGGHWQNLPYTTERTPTLSPRGPPAWRPLPACSCDRDEQPLEPPAWRRPPAPRQAIPGSPPLPPAHRRAPRCERARPPASILTTGLDLPGSAPPGLPHHSNHPQPSHRRPRHFNSARLRSPDQPIVALPRQSDQSRRSPGMKHLSDTGVRLGFRDVVQGHAHASLETRDTGSWPELLGTEAHSETPRAEVSWPELAQPDKFDPFNAAFPQLRQQEPLSSDGSRPSPRCTDQPTRRSAKGFGFTVKM